MRFIDLSATIDPSHPGAKPYERVEVRYTVHTEGQPRYRRSLAYRLICCGTERDGRPAASWQFFLIENRMNMAVNRRVHLLAI